jgi:hypothetical protein
MMVMTSATSGAADSRRLVANLRTSDFIALSPNPLVWICYRAMEWQAACQTRDPVYVVDSQNNEYHIPNETIVVSAG